VQALNLFMLNCRTSTLGRSSLLRNLLFALAALALLCAPALAADSGVSMRIDFLPNLIYDGERLTLCASLVNRTAAAVSGEISCALAAGKRTLADPLTKQLDAAAGKDARIETSWRLVQLKDPVTITVSMTVGAKKIASQRVVVYPASITLPPLTQGDGFLLDDKGERVVLVVRRQVRDPESRWAVVRYVGSAFSDGKLDVAAGLFIGDQLADEVGNSYVSLLKKRPELARFTFVSVAHPTGAKKACGAIYRTLCTFSQSALNRQYDLAMIFVGSEEARFGTDTQEFRRAIDLMSGRLKARGSQHVVFVAPIAPKNLAGRTRLYEREIKSVAHASNSTVLSPQAAVAEIGWGNSVAPRPAAMAAVATQITRHVKSTVSKD
jgi:hypothetical protein